MFNPFTKIKNILLRKSVDSALERLEPDLTKFFIEKRSHMTGWKTVLFNFGTVAITAGLGYLAGIKPEDFGLTGTGAIIFMGAVNFFLRFFTNTSIFKNE